jgi:hypothetical protein
MPPSSSGNGVGTAALWVGIFAFVLSLIPLTGLWWGGPVTLQVCLVLVGLVLGIVGLRKVAKGQATNRTSALTGLVLSAVSTWLWIALLVS